MNKILRLILFTLLLAVAIGLVVSAVGFLFGWRTTTQFSDGLFWSGSLAIVLGVFSVMGNYQMRSTFGVLYAQSAGATSLVERSQRWMSDTLQSYQFYVIAFLVGVLLIGAAVLVGSVL